MTGQKVAGHLAPKIVLFEWLRYELNALGVFAIIMILPIIGIVEADPPIAVVWFFACCITGVLCLAFASRFRMRSNDLMWQIREEGIRTGQVPHPADAIAPQNPSAALPIAAEPVHSPPNPAKGKKLPPDCVPRHQTS